MIFIDSIYQLTLAAIYQLVNFYENASQQIAALLASQLDYLQSALNKIYIIKTYLAFPPFQTLT